MDLRWIEKDREGVKKTIIIELQRLSIEFSAILC